MDRAAMFCGWIHAAMPTVLSTGWYACSWCAALSTASTDGNTRSRVGTAEKGRFVKIMKLLDGMSELKVLGFPPLKNGLLTQEHYAAVRLAAQNYGIPMDSAIKSLLNM